MMEVEPVGETIINGSVYAGVKEENLKFSPGGRVPPLIGGQGFH
jgi:hypothetical protein